MVQEEQHDSTDGDLDLDPSKNGTCEVSSINSSVAITNSSNLLTTLFISQNEYLELTKFDLWICKNAIITRRPVHDDMHPKDLEFAKRSQCTYALCNPCYSKLALSCKVDDNISTGRANKRPKVVNHDCNHNDLFKGLVQGEKAYFNKKEVAKHGCDKCDNCNKLIPLKN